MGLDKRSRLYAQHRTLSSECNSFGAHNKFLVYTTINSVMKFIPLKHLLIQDQSPLDQGAFSSREVERGSRIVSVIPHDIKVIVQMPRGNLEAIFPRILGLDAIRNYLNRYIHLPCNSSSLDFKNAFSLARKHRIDTNLLFDHNPTVFLNNVEEFVRQVNNVDYLNLFISSLRYEDKWVYRNAL